MNKEKDKILNSFLAKQAGMTTSEVVRFIYKNMITARANLKQLGITPENAKDLINGA